jgi:hypothetical protein
MHPLPAASQHLSADVGDSPAAAPTDQVKSGRRAGGRQTRRRTKSVKDKVALGVAPGVES